MRRYRMPLLEYYMRVLWNNKQYIEKGFTIDFVSPHKNIWSLTYVWGKVTFDFRHYTYVDIVPQTCMFTEKFGIRWFSEWLDDYYQQHYHQIYHLFARIYDYSQTYKTDLEIYKIGDKYRLISWNNNSEAFYDVWKTSDGKYRFKTHKEERIADLKGFLGVVEEKFNES